MYRQANNALTETARVRTDADEYIAPHRVSAPETLIRTRQDREAIFRDLEETARGLAEDTRGVNEALDGCNRRLRIGGRCSAVVQIVAALAFAGSTIQQLRSYGVSKSDAAGVVGPSLVVQVMIGSFLFGCYGYLFKDSAPTRPTVRSLPRTLLEVNHTT